MRDKDNNLQGKQKPLSEQGISYILSRKKLAECYIEDDSVSDDLVDKFVLIMEILKSNFKK